MEITYLGNPHVGVAVGIVVALLFIICAVIGAVYFLRKKNLIGIKLSGSVRFDNPKFLNRSNQQPNDTLQIIQNEIGMDSSEAASTTTAWKQETLHATPVPSTEVNPTLYEELRLGSDGVGFKRLK